MAPGLPTMSYYTEGGEMTFLVPGCWYFLCFYFLPLSGVA